VQALAARLAEPATKLLLIVGIAYTLASTGWYFFSDPTPTPVDDARGKTVRSTRPTISLDQILAANMFGKANATSVVPKDVPETHLKLTLEGVFNAEDTQNSAAIIAEQGRPGELFQVGKKLSGGVELVEVHADRVVLKRAGALETLRFPEQTTMVAMTTVEPDAGPVQNDVVPDDQPQEPQQEPAPADSTSADPPTPMSRDDLPMRSRIEQYRSKIDADPNGALSELGVSPVAGDGAKGYQIGNVASSPYLAQSGLQSGDVILSVNGRPVGNVQQDRQEIDNIVAQGSARLEVQRGDRRFFVTASLK